MISDEENELKSDSSSSSESEEKEDIVEVDLTRLDIPGILVLIYIKNLKCLY